jgi:hypothetical protein
MLVTPHKATQRVIFPNTTNRVYGAVHPNIHACPYQLHSKQALGQVLEAVATSPGSFTATSGMTSSGPFRPSGNGRLSFTPVGLDQVLPLSETPGKRGVTCPTKRLHVQVVPSTPNPGTIAKCYVGPVNAPPVGFQSMVVASM